MPLIKLYAGLRKTAGVKEIHVEGSRLSDVLMALAEQYPVLRQALFDGERLRQHIVINVNGNNIDTNQTLEVGVAPEDQIAIFPPIAGG